MREGPTVTDSRSWHRLICSLCPLCPGHDTKLHPRRGPKWASRAYRIGHPPIRYAPAKGRQKVVEYSGEGPKRDFPINTLGSRLPFGCRGRTWCQLYGGRWRMPGSILCYRQFSAATEPALGPVSTMSRPLWGNQNNRRGSVPSFVSGRKWQEQSPLLWWVPGHRLVAAACIELGKWASN